MAQFILVEILNRVASISLNRPEKHNALNPQLIAELSSAIKMADSNPDVKVIILKSSSATFCAGADISYLRELQGNTYQQNLEDSQSLQLLFSTIYNVEKLLIAQVEGNAIAGGCGLVSVCDIVFAVPEALFGYTEVKIGFVPAIVATFLLRKIGEGRSREMLLSGELIPASTAQHYGLVNFVEGEENIAEAVQNYARKMVQNTSPQSVKATKSLLSKIQSMEISEALNYASMVNAQARLTEDFRKGIDAFLNKKHPQW